MFERSSHRRTVNDFTAGKAADLFRLAAQLGGDGSVNPARNTNIRAAAGANSKLKDVLRERRDYA